MSAPISAPAAPALDADPDLDFEHLLGLSPEIFPYKYVDNCSEEPHPLRSWEHLTVLLSHLGSTPDLAYFVIRRTDSPRAAQVVGDPRRLACELLPGDSRVLAVVAPTGRPATRIWGADGYSLDIGAGEELNSAEALAAMRPFLEHGNLPAPPWRLREVIY